ncbi:MAG: hypothetical protein AB8I08_29930 [Sandaracinaceae bacterium]
MIRIATARACAVGLLVLGCTPDVGACDPEGPAFEVVYDEFGTPAMAGQALMIESCGGGGFCHSEGIAAPDRFNAPSGLAFDVTIASTSAQPQDGATARLAVHQARIARMRGEIWAEVDSGRMPPNVEREGVVVDDLYARVDDDGVTARDLPGLDVEEGRTILREWLACGAPVVERTQPRGDELAPVGFTVRACNRRCVDPTFADLHEAVLERSCATGACHDADEPSARLDLTDTGGLNALLSRLTSGTTAATEGCSECQCGDDEAFASMPLITPGEPDASLLYRKVEPERACGGVMPLSGSPLSAQALCALREWIACGAPSDPSSEAECIDAARATCGVQVMGGVVSCAEEDTCANRVDPNRG